MNNTQSSSSIEDLILGIDNIQYANTAMIIINLIMSGWLGFLKIKKRLLNDEAKIEALERKMSRLQRNP